MWNMYRECGDLHFVQQLLTQHDTASVVFTICSSKWLNIWEQNSSMLKNLNIYGKTLTNCPIWKLSATSSWAMWKVWCLKSSILSSGRSRRIQNRPHSCNSVFAIRSLNNVVLPSMTQSLSPTSMLYQGLQYYITQKNIINFFCISQ